MGGTVGKNVSLWRDLSGGADDARLDDEAAASVRYLREVMGE
jgi:D-psicose/D-tagatose/L-ribulose 3-epimerase